jgi:uncharacterized OsmC-like protein
MTQDQTHDNPEVANALERVIADGRSEDGLLVKLNAAGHDMQSDEPSDQGGSGLGPSPYDLLSAALASCTVMTLQMYARHKEWPLEAVHAEVRHGKIHARDCEECESKTGRIDRFDRTLGFEGDLSEEQRSRLLEIADRCPVHRTLKEEVEIRTRLVD